MNQAMIKILAHTRMIIIRSYLENKNPVTHKKLV
jgi:hypothetical protein